MINFKKRKFIKFHLGSKKIRSHIDAIHACRLHADKYTGEIVEGIIKKINCHGIIATVSRNTADLNRFPDPENKKTIEAIKEYRQTIKDILEHICILDKNEKVSRPYLHLAIHGMKDSWNNDVEIGTLHGKTCSPEVQKWFVSEIEKHKKYIRNYQINGKFSGDPSKSVHRHGAQTSGLAYTGYGDNFNTFQIEISEMLRENCRDKLIEIFSNMIGNFNKKFK